MKLIKFLFNFKTMHYMTCKCESARRQSGDKRSGELLKNRFSFCREMRQINLSNVGYFLGSAG